MINLKIILSLSLFLSSPSALAFEALWVPSTKSKFLKQQPRVTKWGETRLSFTFTPQERKNLRRLGATRLAASRTLKFKNEAAFLKAQKLARRSGEQLDPRKFIAQTQNLKDTFADLQWGLSNQGVAPQEVDLSSFNLLVIPNRPGQQVNTVPLKSNRKIRVALLDTGYDHSHLDLKNVVHTKPSECEALKKLDWCKAYSKGEPYKDKNGDTLTAEQINQGLRIINGERPDPDKVNCDRLWYNLENPEVDQDKNGYPMDCQGWSLTKTTADAAKIVGSPEFLPDSGHGTHIAGIMGAEANNDYGVRGVAPGIEIIPVQVIEESPNEPVKPLSISLEPQEGPHRPKPERLADFVARGILYAISPRDGTKTPQADVINMSLCWPGAGDTELMSEMVKVALAKNVIVVAAAGNDATQALPRPCSYPGVICVGSHNSEGAISYFSNYGDGVDVFAPGLSIFSTYPMKLRPLRFRAQPGFGYLTGSSQSAGFVSAAAAILLSHGKPPQEVRARLIASSRAPLTALAPVDKMVGTFEHKPLNDSLKMFGRGGNLDIAAALNLAPSPVFVLEMKDPQLLPWNRHDREISWPLEITNIWQAINLDQLTLKVDFYNSENRVFLPKIKSFKLDNSGNKIWARGEKRILNIALEIVDNVPERSRMPSDLSLQVQIQQKAKPETQKLVARAEVVVPVNELLSRGDAARLTVEGLNQKPEDFLFIENINDPGVLDYLAVYRSEKDWQYWRLHQLGSGLGQTYNVVGKYVLPVPGQKDIAQEHMRILTDLDGDGQQEFIFGFIEDPSFATEEEIKEKKLKRKMLIHEFGADFNLKNTFTIDGEKYALPRVVQFMKNKERKVMAWIGPGMDPDLKTTLYELRRNPSGYEAPKMRFYYLDQAGRIQKVEKHEKYDFMSLIEATPDQVRRGAVAVLLAQNTGTEMIPSFLVKFARAEVIDGKVENIQVIGEENNYRQLLDARWGRVNSLLPGTRAYSGDFWFGDGAEATQRMSLLLDKANDLSDFIFKPMRPYIDSVRWVRAVFSGPTRLGAFAISNSELQYHDLLRRESVHRSLERYTFLRSLMFLSIQFPLVIVDQDNPQEMLPGIFSIESSGLTAAFKLLAPVYKPNGALAELSMPAKLRLKTSDDCKAIDSVSSPTRERPGVLDFYCQNTILRVPLIF